MPLAELMSQIQELSKIDKLRLMQFLATELSKKKMQQTFLLPIESIRSGRLTIALRLPMF